MHIKRDIDNFLAKRMFGGKTLVIYGPRQSGKTTAIETYFETHGLSANVVTFNGDETADREMLADASADKLKMLLGGKSILFIDEAHKVPVIGLVLKRAWDKLKGIQTIASGSSSIELADKIESVISGGKSEICFIIGGFDGLDESIKAMCDLRLSFSKMTFPHRLMRVFLLEQIYRAFTIINHQNYHH